MQRGVVEEDDADADEAEVDGRRAMYREREQEGEEVDGGALADEEDGMDVEPMDVEL